MSEIKLVLPGKTEEPKKTEMATLETMANQAQEEADVAMSQAGELSDEELAQVRSFAKQIDLHDSAVIVSYGAPAQQKLNGLATGALENVTGQDVGEIGDLLAKMSTSIKGFNKEAESSKTPSLFRSVKKKAEQLRVRYDSVENTLKGIADNLERQRLQLLVDIEMLDDMYESNLNYYKELKMYIEAGKMKLKEVRGGELAELKKKAEATHDREDAQRYNDLRSHCENFDKQLYDLELTQTICMQTAPQIRLVQNTNMQLVQKIQSSINNSIPLWKQKLGTALGMQHSQEAAAAQKEMADLTSQMLEENAKLLHMGTVAAARESERGIIDVNSVMVSNQELIETIKDLFTIQEEGRTAREEARAKLQQAGNELRQVLLDASQRGKSYAR